MNTAPNPYPPIPFDFRPKLLMQASTLDELSEQMRRDLHGPMDFHDFIVAHHERVAAERIAREAHMVMVRRVASRFAAR